MPPWVRYKYLKDELGVVNDRVALARAIDNLGFPAPRALGERTVAWDLTEVEEWIASRPRRVPKVKSARKRGPAPTTASRPPPSGGH